MHHIGRTILVVGPEAIDTGSPALFWAEEPDVRLIDSMREHGQFQPVHVVRDGARMLLVAGYRRVKSALHLGLDVRAVEVAEMTALDRGIAYLLSNMERTPTEAMLVRAMRYFHACCREQELRERILPLLGVAPGARQAGLLLQWTSLEQEWDPLLARQAIPLAAADILSRISADERESLLPFFHGLKWSRQSALQWLTWIFERARTEGVGMGELIERAGMRSIPGIEGLSPKDAIERLCESARAMRYPLLSGMRGRFETLAASLARGTRWTISQPTLFETTDVELKARCRSQGDLERIAREFDSIRAGRQWVDLWAVVGAGPEGEGEGDEQGG
jgi:ParB family transcriptional regulator, chromosome partitioning protein